MQYQEYRTLRDAIVRERSPLRLDCMNPSKALNRLAPTTRCADSTVQDALAAWSALMMPADISCRILATTGVRGALQSVFEKLAQAGFDLWLPEDVYPQYAVIAKQCRLSSRCWVTLPEPILSALEAASNRAALLLPYPLTPLGRYLRPDEIHRLEKWLAEGSERWLILDTAYLFESRLDATLVRFIKQGRTLLVHSLAKAWLLPDTLGILVAPSEQASFLSCETHGLSADALARACSALRECPALPDNLSTIFKNAWSNCEHRLLQASIKWHSPETGYFSIIDVGFDQLLDEQNILGVPASVFGSSRDDLTVLSCLHDAV